MAKREGDIPSGRGPGSRSLRIAPRSGEVGQARPRRSRTPRELDELPSDEDVERFGDVTRTCPECGKEVFDDAAVCYHCGYAFEKTTAGSSPSPKWIVITVIVIIVAFGIAAILGLF
jgi:hypothetical protein